MLTINSVMCTRDGKYFDPGWEKFGSGMEKFGSRIRNKHHGTATMVLRTGFF
jgi:hypothetical protein